MRRDYYFPCLAFNFCLFGHILATLTNVMLLVFVSSPHTDDTDKDIQNISAHHPEVFGCLSYNIVGIPDTNAEEYDGMLDVISETIHRSFIDQSNPRCPGLASIRIVMWLPQSDSDDFMAGVLGDLGREEDFVVLTTSPMWRSIQWRNAEFTQRYPTRLNIPLMTRMDLILTDSIAALMRKLHVDIYGFLLDDESIPRPISTFSNLTLFSEIYYDLPRISSTTNHKYNASSSTNPSDERTPQNVSVTAYVVPVPVSIQRLLFEAFSFSSKEVESGHSFLIFLPDADTSQTPELAKLLVRTQQLKLLYRSLFMAFSTNGENSGKANNLQHSESLPRVLGDILTAVFGTLERHRISSSRDFIRHFTFDHPEKTLGQRPKNLDTTENRTISFSRLDGITHSFKEVFVYHSFNRSLWQSDFFVWNMTSPTAQHEDYKSPPYALPLGIAIGVCLLLLLCLFSGIRIRGLWSTSSWLILEEQVTFQAYGRYVVKDYVIPSHGPNVMIECAEISFNGTNAIAVTIFKNFPLSRVKRSPLALLILKILKDMNHENLCKFHGIIWIGQFFNSHRMAYVSERPFKDTLRSVIDDEDYAMNWDLRFSLIWDLAQGLRYIQRSLLRFHGSITSLAVGIDPRFTLKICLVGVAPLSGVLLTEKEIDEYAPDLTMKVYSLWLPPEVLLDPKQLGDPRVDSYSFGVLLYEITTRNSPFNVDLNDMSVLDGISDQMLNGTFEPIDLIQGDLPEPVDQLIIDCLKRDKTQRPLVSAIIDRLSVIYPQRAGMSFSDSLVDRMLQYHTELEEIVIEKTESLQAEARRVEAILHNLLPPGIVSILNRGEQVPLEEFDQVTVLFSDVPMIADLSGVISPIQLFGLLEDLCLVVDAIISTFNVFKVEAIKDSYMVVGGAPVRMGKRHVKEVAYLALKIMNGVKRISVKGDCLTARIGMHSGPCVAGVVGTKLPHYTVFGDTVNFASRMNSSGEVGRIQMSKFTYEELSGENDLLLIPRGLIEVKGKGQQFVYWLEKA